MEIAAVIFVLIAAAIAYIAFRILKRTLRIAIRLIVALLILLFAVIVGVGLMNMYGGPSAEMPAASETR